MKWLFLTEVLGAMISILIIWVITGVLIYEAIKRVIDQDYEIEPNAMLVTASLGVIFNIMYGISLIILCASTKYSLFSEPMRTNESLSLYFSMGLVLNFGTCCGAVAHSHGLGGHGHSHGGGNGHSHGDGHDHSHGDNHSDSHHHGHSHGHSPGDNQTSNHGNNTGSQDHCHDNQAHSDNHQPAYAPPDGATDYDGRVDIQDIDVAKFKDKRNINVRAAFIHVIGDLIQSIGVFIAAVIIKIQVSLLVIITDRYS